MEIIVSAVWAPKGAGLEGLRSSFRQDGHSQHREANKQRLSQAPRAPLWLARDRKERTLRAAALWALYTLASLVLVCFEARSYYVDLADLWLILSLII